MGANNQRVFVSQVVARRIRCPGENMVEMGAALGLGPSSIHNHMMTAWEWGLVYRSGNAYLPTARGYRFAGIPYPREVA